MNRRLALYEQASRHTLDAAEFSELQKLAGLTVEPPELQRLWSTSCAIAGAALLGIGIIFFLAANWAGLGRFGRLGLAEALVVVSAAGMLWRPAWKVPLGLLCFLAVGGLFACIGQTYQTGADPWQLFAVWAALTIPVCLATRTDALWLPWVIVVTTSITLCMNAHSSTDWFHSGDFSLAQTLGWLANLSLAVSLRFSVAEKIGVGQWSRQLALVLLIICITVPAASAALHSRGLISYRIGLLFLAGMAVWLAWPRRFDLFGLCAVMLALNVLLDIGVSRGLFQTGESLTGNFAVVTSVVAGLIWASTALVFKLQKRNAAPRRQS